jgi:hypothetical protein
MHHLCLTMIELKMLGLSILLALQRDLEGSRVPKNGVLSPRVISGM